ncbi:hypothetical protein BpHYR1_009795 [Brachionus plicatilis]|uniref:Uncharacterized protein n=1 Tax=Brachionus plicatilis TaxID=10195 RepID=A0A3M7SV09_BRAPC|nr:hypothetical protein BpHYR1_009795 [Brachionus plicatilis]
MSMILLDMLLVANLLPC